MQAEKGKGPILLCWLRDRGQDEPAFAFLSFHMEGAGIRISTLVGGEGRTGNCQLITVIIGGVPLGGRLIALPGKFPQCCNVAFHSDGVFGRECFFCPFVEKGQISRN